MKLSILQILRTPLKTAILLLMLGVSTAMLVFSTVLLADSDARIAEAERMFTTIGTVSQKPESTDVSVYSNSCLPFYSTVEESYDRFLSVDLLNFDGAEYLTPPEERPYYLTSIDPMLMQIKNPDKDFPQRTEFLLFTALEDSDGTTPFTAQVTDVFYERKGEFMSLYSSITDEPEHAAFGDTITVCQHYTGAPRPVTAGQQYAAFLTAETCEQHGETEWVVIQMPFCSLQTRSGEAIPGVNPSGGTAREAGDAVRFSATDRELLDLNDPNVYLIPFDGDGEAVKRELVGWIQFLIKQDTIYNVLPTNSLTLLPSFHSRRMYLAEGREITEEEFETGAKVCMISREMAEGSAGNNTHLIVGSHIMLPLYASLYGYTPDLEEDRALFHMTFDAPSFIRRYSLLDVDGRMLDAFEISSYEVVGIYDSVSDDEVYAGASEIARGTFIIPAKSVKASDEDHIVYVGPMRDTTVSFEIPNGTADEFDRALREAVPEAAKLEITYDDGGYARVVGSIENTRTTSVLLFAVSAAMTLVFLLFALYVFILQQKKRTAIERSLGMTKRQCRISLLGGSGAAVALAAFLGSALGAAAVALFGARITADPTAQYDLTFSSWAHNAPAVTVVSPLRFWIGVVLPLAAAALYLGLGTVLVNRNLKADPIELISARW